MAKSNYKREIFLINKEIQSAYMISFLVPMTIMLLIMAAIFAFALRSGISSSVEMVYRDVNDNLANSLVGKSDPSVRDYKNAIDEVRQMLMTENSTLNRNRNTDAIITSMMYILLPGFFLAIVELVFLTVFFSHKIAGPVFRIELACKRVIDGDYGEEIHLRTGDKMGNLAKLFNEMIKITKKRMNEALKLQNETEKETFRTQNKL